MNSQEFFARFLRVATLAAKAPVISEKALCQKANGTVGEINYQVGAQPAHRRQPQQL
jgi:hypothetical protein